MFGLRKLFASLTARAVVGGGTVYHVDKPFQFLAHAAGQGPIDIVVVGDPFPGQSTRVAAVLAEAFDRTFKSLGNPFRVVSPTPEAAGKIIVLFNVEPSLAARTICADPQRIVAGPSAARTTARAIYCGDGPYSDYAMSFPTPASPDDPKFAELMADLADRAIPREPNPERFR